MLDTGLRGTDFPAGTSAVLAAGGSDGNALLPTRCGDELERRGRSGHRAILRVLPGMLKRGHYLPPSAFEALFLSAAHTERHMDALLEDAGEALDEAFS